VTALGVHNADEIERVRCRAQSRAHNSAAAVTLVNGKLIVELAARHELPAVYAFASFAQAGGLISHGIDLVDQFRQGLGMLIAS
jgi:hypothetical protein